MVRRSSPRASSAMSPSTRSKSASPTSPASGDATEPEPDAAPDSDDTDGVEIELELSRERLWGWAIGGVILGLLLIWKLGTVGVWTGYVLVALGLYRAFLLVQTFRHPPGTIAVSAERVR